MKKTFLAMMMAGYALAQQGGTVALSKGNPTDAFTILYYYDGSNNLQYICKTPAFRTAQSYTWGVTAALNQGTLTSIVVLTNVGTVTTSADHGLAVGNLVVVSGSTTAALNGTYVIQTVPTSTTFTITTSGVANATYNNAAMTMTTTAPRTTATGWSIEKFTYDASSNLVADQMATRVASGQIATNAYSFICGNRAVTTGATAIAFQ